MLFPVERRMDRGRRENDFTHTLMECDLSGVLAPFSFCNNEGCKDQSDFDRSGIEKLIVTFISNVDIHFTLKDVL